MPAHVYGITKRIVLITFISLKLIKSKIKSTFLRMNTFAHANSFATPTFLKCNIFMCRKLLRCADQLVGCKTHSVDKNSLCSCLYDYHSVINFSLNNLSCGSVFRRSDGCLLLHYCVERAQFVPNVTHVQSQTANQPGNYTGP